MSLATLPEPRIVARDDQKAALPESRPASGRLASIDAYRGLVMALMVSEGLGIPERPTACRNC